MNISTDRTRSILLANGFKLKEQPSGAKDLHPYVFQGVAAVVDAAIDSAIKTIASAMPGDCQPPRDTLAGLMFAIAEMAARLQKAEAAISYGIAEQDISLSHGEESPWSAFYQQSLTDICNHENSQ